MLPERSDKTQGVKRALGQEEEWSRANGLLDMAFGRKYFRVFRFFIINAPALMFKLALDSASQ